LIHSSTNLFHQNIITQITNTIKDNYGQEVFFIAWIDKEGIVSEIEAIAFGNDECVPAPLSDGLKGDLVIHNHPSGDLRASNPDINIASLLATRKLGFYIINNDCSKVHIIYKPKPKIFLQEKSVLSLFQKGGLLSEYFGSYEERPEQELLIQKIITAINDDKVFMAEAGTGTGKSLAYLIPSTIWAVQSDKRVFITTHTINLQNQIAKKDAELVSIIVEKFTGIKPRFAVLVGRNNYLCPKILNEIYNDPDKMGSLFDNPNSISNQLEIIKAWAEYTEEGLRAEIPEKISSELWDEISASTPNCPRKECPFYTDCYYYKARMIAESSHIIIGNHSLLLSSIDEENGFIANIPHFSGLVLDEAHNLGHITLNSMANSFSFGSITWRLSRLYRQKGDKFLGQLNLLRDRSALDRSEKLSSLFYQITNTILNLSSSLKENEEKFRQYFVDQQELYIEINIEVLSQQNWKAARSILDQIFIEIRQIESLLTKLSERTIELIPGEHIIEILRIIDIHNTSLYTMRQTYNKIFNDHEDQNIAIRQMELSTKVINFSAGPADVGDFLAKHIFRPKDFTILTSATLSINNSFNFFAQEIGLSFIEDQRVDQISLPSPFDYKKQMEVLVLDDSYLNYSNLNQEKLELVRKAIYTVGGGALLLFTSHKAMDIAFKALADDFTNVGLYPLKQGDHSREYLLNTMRSKDYTVLFGTASFWEGIDVQGDNLRFLIIDKLPFDHPNNPLTKAISRIILSQGKNPFMEYSIPRAVLKYKQGIGRLIRSKKDRGILLVLDSRIFSKKYGKYFINTTKPAISLFLSPHDILNKIQQFFKIKSN